MRRYLAVLLIALLAVFSVNAARVQVNNVPAIISDLVVNLTSIFTPSAAQVIDAVGDTILANAVILELNPDANHTLTSTPHIADGTEGQIVIITTDPAEGNTVTIQDQGTLGGSNILLLNSIASRIIGAGNSIGLRFNGADWEEVWYNGQIDISTDTNLVGGTNITLSDDTLNVDDAFLVNDASDTMTGDLTLNNADPALIFDPTTADTEFYIAINEDAGDDDDDTFTIGKGTTKGTTPFMTWDKDGGFIAQNLADAVTGYQWLDSDGGTSIFNIDTTNERVGIRNDAPAGMFQVSNGIVIDVLNGVSDPNTAYPYIFITDGGGGGLRPAESGNLVFQARSSAARDIIFVTGTAPAEVVTIYDTGNVKIGGTTQPNERLSLIKESADTIQIITTYDNDATELPELNLRKADNTEASPALVDDDDVLGVVRFSGYDGSGFHEGARIEGRIDGTPSDGTDMPTELTFWTTPEASATAVQRMTVDPDGNMGIGTIAPNATLEVKGPNPGNVGGFAAGALQVTAEGAAQFTPAVITGHNSYNTNTQLWYLGSLSSANDDIVFINRQDAALSLYTNNLERLRINKDGEVSGDPFNDQETDIMTGAVWAYQPTLTALWAIGRNPATTEPDVCILPTAHDATYNNFVAGDQLYKAKTWAMSFYTDNDEYMTVSDHADLSWDDSGANPQSFCFWIEVDNTAAIQTVIAKYDVQNTLREWKIVLDASEKLEFAIYDESANVESTNITDAALSEGWHFVVHTYDSTGGAAALSDANSIWYVDGAAVAESQSNDGAYVAMEDLAVGVTIGGYDTGAAIANFFQGDMSLMGIIPAELTATEVAILYQMTKGYYNE